MSFHQWLIHTCTIQDYTTNRGATGELAKTWANKATAADCRLVIESERVANENAGGMVLTTHKLLLPAGTSVTNEDRITNVRLKADNSVVDAGPFQIEQVLPRNSKKQRHISLMLEKIDSHV